MSNIETTTGGFVSQKNIQITAENFADHGEITISKTQWNLICSKIEKIDLKKTFNISNIIIGIVITNIFNFICKWIQIEKFPQENLLPVTVSLILYIAVSLYNKKKQNIDSDNRLHLDDVKEMIQNINVKKQHHEV